MQYRISCAICLCLAAIVIGTANAQDDAAGKKPPESKLDQFWFPPELVLHHAERLEISDEQRAAIENQFLESRKTMEVRHADLQAATRRLYEKIAGSASDEEVLGQLDQVLENERLIKRLQMATLLRIRRQLTPEQLATIGELKAGFEAEQRELQHDIQSKISRIQRMFQKRAEAAQPPLELRERMKEFEALMKSGKAREAKAALDRIVQEFVDSEDADEKPSGDR